MGLVNFLQNLAKTAQVNFSLGIHIKRIVFDAPQYLQSLSQEDSQAYGQFLSKLLKATMISGGDAQKVYPLVKENIDKFDDKLAKLLRAWSKTTLEKVKPDEAKYLAAVILLFSNLILQFHWVNKASNMEIVITGYEIALTVYTRHAFSDEWAGMQTNLAAAYIYRIRGDKAENLEQAIVCCQDALKIYTLDAFSYEWAATQNNLGEAYRNRIRGDKAENLEQAIAYYQDALKVYTFEAFPQDWAKTQINLANAYCERIRGDKAENLEQAIVCCQDALKIYTLDAFSYEWAATQNNLGEAYRNRIRGDKAENLEQAIAYYQDALKVYTFEEIPYEWAATQINLGIAYSNRIRGDNAENLEQAIAYYQEALKVYTFEAFPQDWAQTQGNLATAYRKAENLELAIACHKEVLKIYTFEAFPQYWAATQNNLANTYSDILAEDKAENLEQAIICYQKALKVRTFERFPQDWAMTQYNLAKAYGERIKGNKADNLEVAIAASKKALTVRTNEAFPQDHADTLGLLGFAYQNKKQFTLAYNSFASAITTIESLREEIISGAESKRKQAEHFNHVYRFMVEVCLELGNLTEAIEYIERSKTRNLIELILERDSKTIFPPEIVTQLEKYRDEIAAGQYQIQNGKAENPNSLAQHLQELRQQRNELQNRYLPVGSGFKFDQFQLTLDQCTAIIEWYITEEKILAFVIKPNGEELTVWQSQPEDLEALENWGNEYLQDYDKTDKKQWRDKLDERLKQLSEILHLESILAQIPPKYDRLLLIPHRLLHLLPLHALSVGESYLLDRFPLGVGYAPSCQLLQQVQQRERPDFQSLFAIQNPTGDLEFTDQEVNSILSLFPSHQVQVLSNSHATKAALDEATLHLQEANYLHFSCHGSFIPDSPFLLLADAIVSSIPTDADPKQYLKTSKGFIDLSKCLTLGNLFERGFDLNKCRLVVLSACETGLIDFDNSSDEYIGLPSGFLYAGSSSVVSSLWTVDDMSTAYLMIKFLQNLKAAFDRGEDILVAVALNQAQHWLRNITWKDLEKWAKNLQLDSSNNRQIERSMLQMREIVAKNARSKKIDEKPFQSPYHWAGFTAIGK